MQPARPVVVQDETARVRMPVWDDARDRRERRPGRVNVRLYRDELARRKGEHVVKAIAACLLALVGTRHDDEAGLTLAGEGGAGLGKRVRRDGDADRVRDGVVLDYPLGKTCTQCLDHRATPSIPATAANPSRSAGGSHRPITRRATSGRPMKDAANGNGAGRTRAGAERSATRRTCDSIPAKTSTLPASSTTAPASAPGRPANPACAIP